MTQHSVSPEGIRIPRPPSVAIPAISRKSQPYRKLLLLSFLPLAMGADACAQNYLGKDLYIATVPVGYEMSTLVPLHEPVGLGQYAGIAIGPDGFSHALVWQPPDGKVVDLNPVGSEGSIAYATDGHQQVGTVYLPFTHHAAVWSGTAKSMVDLNPSAAGFASSDAYGVGGGQQVGSGVAPGNYTHALLWSGTAESAVDLDPKPFTSSVANGTDGQQQVGYEYLNGSNAHAMLWSGTADSAVDLDDGPLAEAFSDSVAFGVGGGQQVGLLSNNSPTETHAALWNGTAASIIDLHPSDAQGSVAYATDGHIQVGYSISFPPSFVTRARLWKGTAESSVDLEALLPSDLNYSTAYSIDAAGNIYGLAYGANDGAIHAVEWLTQAANLANISTRAHVGIGDNVLIAGFIVNGTQDKPILIRGIGPSLGLPPVNLPTVLQDPILELHDSTGATIGSNDNWKETQQTAIEATGLAPAQDTEAAILSSLSPGAYTVILRGANGTVGTGLVEFYDLDTGVDSRLPNISSRALVETGDDVMIGGFIVGGAENGTVIVRAIGPSLKQFDVKGALADPTLDLYDETGALISSNDNWEDTQQDAIMATGLAPSDTKESAILEILAPGSYTALVRGTNNTSGVALVEAYRLESAP